jgi:histidine decarboxylase
VSVSPAPIPPDEGLAIGVQPSDPAADTRRLLALAAAVRGRVRRTPGIPGALDCSVDELAPLLGVLLNSAGDPDSGGTHGAEPYGQAVLEYFTAAAGAAVADTHGYVASSSGEAVLNSLHTARRALPGARVYASGPGHPRVKRACDLLRMELVTIDSLPEGTMDAEDLRIQALIRRRTGPGPGRKPGAIVVATCGTPLRSLVGIELLLQAGL